MDIKIEGRQVEIGNELRERIQKRMNNLDKRFGPLTHARMTVEKNPHHKQNPAMAKAVVNLAGKSITATKEAENIMAAVNETLDTLAHEVQEHAEKKKTGRR
ncbi:MAG: ribosome-associated translation inhibitor RaiA [Magnetococcales bacterium]|nr:ribosome-associated translation inhibitor RaiA [Magnetococcales bacterium]